MKLSLRSRLWRKLLHTFFKGQRLTIAENRARSAKMASFSNRIPKDIHTTRVDIDGIPAEWITPVSAQSENVVLHFHGGGYVVGGIASHLMMCIPMAQTVKIKILLPEYRLAPEHPFPAAVDDALRIYRWLLAQGYKAGNIIVCGDSAGGGLSLALVLSLIAAGQELPAAVVCMSPWTDLTMKGQSQITNAKSEAVLRTDVLREWASAYIGKENPMNPIISPVFADFHGFPPLLIQVGSDEILLDDARALAEKAKADGVDVTLKVWDGMWHVWQALGDLIPESRKAFNEIKGFVLTHTSLR